MASFGPRRLPKVRQGGLLYKFWRPAIPRGVRPLKRVAAPARAGYTINGGTLAQTSGA